MKWNGKSPLPLNALCCRCGKEVFPGLHIGMHGGKLDQPVDFVQVVYHGQPDMMCGACGDQVFGPASEKGGTAG